MGVNFCLELGLLDREGNWVPKSKEKSIEFLWKKATINFCQNVYFYIKKDLLCARNQSSWERIVDGIDIRNHGIRNDQDNWNLIATTFSSWLFPVSIMLQWLNFPHKWTSRKYGISCWLHKFLNLLLYTIYCPTSCLNWKTYKERK